MPTTGPPDDELDALYRQMLAETMRPCPEVPRHIRAGWAAVAAIRSDELDARTGTRGAPQGMAS